MSFLERALPRSPASASSARRLVRQWAADAGVPADDLSLVVSELVTNAVLHADGDHVHVRLSAEDGVTRLEVEDHYPGLPVRRAVTNGAAGNGVPLLDTLADAWGATPTGPGKVVGAEFGTSPGAGAAPAPAGAIPEQILDAEVERFRGQGTAGSAADLVPVVLLALPLQLFAEQLARHRELLRELALVARAPGRRDPAALVHLARELERYRGMAESTEGLRAAASAAGQVALDVDYLLPASAGPACRRLIELLGEADDFARAEALLVLPPAPDEVAVREWFLCQIAEQCAGAPARSWPATRAG